MKLSTGTFASESEDRWSNEVEGKVDSNWLEGTPGKSKGEGSEATGRPGEAAFLLRKAVRRVLSGTWRLDLLFRSLKDCWQWHAAIGVRAEIERKAFSNAQ